MKISDLINSINMTCENYGGSIYVSKCLDVESEKNYSFRVFSETGFLLGFISIENKKFMPDEMYLSKENLEEISFILTAIEGLKEGGKL